MKRLAVLAAVCLMLSGFVPARAQRSAQEAFFDGAVFIGDSIMQQIGRYKLEQGERGRPILGDARFITASSYTLYQGSRLTPAAHKTALRYAGKKVSLPDALRQAQAKRAFVLLGLNDRAGTQLDQEMLMYRRLIERTLARNPGLDLIILSVTPITKGGQTRHLKQENFNAFNARLEALCAETGVGYLDAATPLMDEEGYLKPEYCSDNRVHLSREGMAVFIQTIEAFAQSQATP